MAMIGKHREYAHWFDPRLKNRMLFPWWRRYWELLRSVYACELRFATRMKCCYHWLKWAYLRKRCLLQDIAFNLRYSVRSSIYAQSRGASCAR